MTVPIIATELATRGMFLLIFVALIVVTAGIAIVFGRKAYLNKKDRPFEALGEPTAATPRSAAIADEERWESVPTGTFGVIADVPLPQIPGGGLPPELSLEGEEFDVDALHTVDDIPEPTIAPSQRSDDHVPPALSFEYNPQHVAPLPDEDFSVDDHVAAEADSRTEIDDASHEVEEPEPATTTAIERAPDDEPGEEPSPETGELSGPEEFESVEKPDDSNESIEVISDTDGEPDVDDADQPLDDVPAEPTTEPDTATVDELDDLYDLPPMPQIAS